MGKVEKEVKRIGRQIDKAIIQPVVKTVEAIVEDPKKLLAVGLAVAFPGAGAALGAQLGLTGAAAQVVGQTLINTAFNGGDVKSAVLSAAIPVMGGPAAAKISETLGEAGIEGALNKVVTNAATKGLTAAVLNQDIGDALVSSLVQSAPSIVSQYVPQFAELPRAVQEAAVTATSDLLRTGGTNLESIAFAGVANAATDYAIKNVQGYDDLRPGQKEIVRNGVSNLLQGKNVTATLLNGAISFGQEAVQNEINENTAKDAGWADYKTQQAAKSMYGSKVTPELYADKQETTEAEAKQIARDILGREPTEFEYMQLIGLPEREAAQNSDLKAIQYDESTFDSNELIEAYKGLYGKEPTAEWLASDEAMDMLGRSDAQGTNELQNFYTKDKNWVTEDEASQFWKDMGNTGPAPQEFLDAMLMTTENGAKAMAEAHRINAEDIAATTFDGSQYATPQEAADAAKAAGFNAFTHKDKNLTYFTQPSPVEEANIRADVEEKKTFNEAFAAARKELGAGKTFTWNGKQYTTNVMPKDTFDASRSSTITTAATLALANGKDKFIGPDGKTYKLDDNAKSVLANSVNQSAAETQRLLNLKPTTDETPAETQRLMEAGTRGTMDTIGAMTAQALGTTQRGLGNFLSNAGKTYAAVTGDLDFDNAAIRLGKEIETYAKGNDIYGLDVQKTRLSQAMARANETDNWVEKTKILGSAIGSNSLGFFDVAGSEVVEELPETILQIGAALMTGGGTLAASGAVAAIGAAGSVMETFGSTVEDTYDKAKKAGFSNDEAMNKAYLNGVLSTAIEAGTNFVADKALLAPFLNKFTGTLAGTATGFVSSTTIGAASELAAGLSQSYATQYMIDPETASLSKAATDGIFEMFIGGTAQGTMGLPGYAIQGGAIIGKDYSGRDVTMADVAAGAVLDSSTVDPNTTIATSEDGDPVTLGGAMLQMPNYQFDMSTLKTYVPQVFNNDDLVVGQDELGNTVTYGDLLGQTTESKGFDAVYKSLMDITPEQRTEAKYDYVADLFGDLGYNPTTQEINDLIAQNPAVSQIDKAEIEKYVDPLMVTEQEAKDAYAALGLNRPTQADILKLVGQYDQAGLTGKATENLDAARYNSLLQQIEQIGTQAGVDPAALDAIKNDLNAQITALGGDVTKLQSGLDSVVAGQADTAEQISSLQKDLSKEIKDSIAGIEFPASLTEADVTSAIASYMEANPSATAADVAAAISEYMTANPGLTKTDLDNAVADAIKELATTDQLVDLQNNLTDEIQAALDIGLEGDAAIQAGLDSLAEKVGTNQADLLAQLGTTEAGLKEQFAADIAAYQEATAQEIADTRTALETAIADAKASGLEGDAALQAAIDAVAADQETNAAGLLEKLGTTEAGLKTEFAEGLAGVSAEVADTRKALEDAIKAAQDIGLEGDTALQTAIESVAAELGTTKEALLENLGTTEAALRTDMEAGFAGVATSIADTRTALEAAISDAKAAGLEGDAALQAAIESVAADQQTSAADLLEKLGTTEADLKTEFAAGLAGVSAEVADTRKALEDAIQAAKDVGLEGDAALQAGIDSVASELGTTKEALLTQLGTTEETLRTEFATGISGLETQMQEQYDALTAAQRETADALLAQGKTLADAITEAQATTSGQISDLEAQTTEQYNTLTAAQKETADALVEQGKTLSEAVETARAEAAEQLTDTETRLTDAIAAAEAAGLTRDEAITSAVESVAADLGTTKEALLTQLGATEETLRTEFSTGLAGVSAEVKAAYDSLTAEQQALANQLTEQGSTLAEAIETVRTETAGQIGALSADVQAKYDSLSAEQKALAENMAQQGMDLTAAIDLAAQQTQAQITGLGEQVDARINELMQQGQTYQQATQQAIGELNTQNQQLQGLVGTQGRQATQADIDALSQMLGGQRDMDLSYDVTGDKQITQDDIDFLTQVVGGVNTDWRPPVGSAFGPTGLYGQLATNEAQRQADLQAQLAREQAAAEEAQRQGKIANVRGMLAQGQQGVQSAAQQLPQAFQQSQQVSTPLYGAMEYFDPFSDPFADPFGTPKMRMASSTNPADQTKMAAGGYIDDLLAGDLSVDELLDLLR